MKKLTLEKLAPYLSHKIKFMSPCDGPQEITGMTDLSHVSYYDNETDAGDDIHIEDVELILYPLEYLTKEIEVNGERFVPIDKINKLYADGGLEFIIHNEVIEEKNHTGSFFHLNPNCYPYYIIKKLYEWHFAINIPEELYINKAII